MIDVEGATGYYDSRIDNKVAKTIEFITKDEYSYAFMHVKAIDDAGHDKNL